MADSEGRSTLKGTTMLMSTITPTQNERSLFKKGFFFFKKEKFDRYWSPSRKRSRAKLSIRREEAKRQEKKREAGLENRSKCMHVSKCIGLQTWYDIRSGEYAGRRERKRKVLTIQI